MPKTSLLVLVLALKLLIVSSVHADELKIAVPSKMENIDPVKIWSLYELIIVSSYCRPLFQINDDGGIEGHLVKKWSISKDLTKYTLYLREGIMFHDGSSLTATDVHHSLSRHFWQSHPSEFMNHLSLALGKLGPIPDKALLPSLKVTDPLTIKMTLSEPYLPFLKMLAQTALCITKEGHPMVGTGPMTVIKDVNANGWRLRKFEKYFGEKSSISDILVVSSLGGEQKDVDLTIGSHLAKSDSSEDLEELGFISINHFLFNPNKSVLKDQKIRKLIGQILQKIAWKTQNIPKAQSISPSLVPSGYFSRSKLISNKSLEVLIEELSSRKSQFKEPLQISLVSRHFSENFFKELGEIFEKMGIAVTVKRLKGPEWSQLVNNSSYQITHLPVGPAFYDPDGLLLVIEEYFPQSLKNGFLEAGRYRHKTDKTERMQGYLRALKQIEDQWVVVPAYSIKVLYKKNSTIEIPKTQYRNEFEVWRIKKK